MFTPQSSRISAESPAHCARKLLIRGGSERGAALLAALCFATVLTIALGSYMTLCTRTLALSSRSVQGALSVELAETGITAPHSSDLSG